MWALTTYPQGVEIVHHPKAMDTTGKSHEWRWWLRATKDSPWLIVPTLKEVPRRRWMDDTSSPVEGTFTDFVKDKVLEMAVAQATTNLHSVLWDLLPTLAKDFLNSPPPASQDGME